MKGDSPILRRVVIDTRSQQFVRTLIDLVKDEPEVESYRITHAKPVRSAPHRTRAGKLLISYLRAREEQGHDWTPLRLIEHCFEEFGYKPQSASPIISRLCREKMLDKLTKKGLVYHRCCERTPRVDADDAINLLIRQMMEDEE